MIASGTYGQVFVSTNNPSQVVKKIALKDISLLENKEMLTKISKEHPHIAKVFDVCTFGDEMFIHMKRYVADVRQYVLKNNVSLTEEETLRLDKQVGSAISYLHKSLRVLHGDVKPENILVDEATNFFLCDFSLSMHLDMDKLSVSNQIYSFPFRPPILLFNDQLPDGNRLREEYDFYALFMTLCFGYAFFVVAEDHFSDYEYIQSCCHHKTHLFSDMLNNEFKNLFYKKQYAEAMKACF